MVALSHAVTEFPIWNTVRLGIYRTQADYRRALKIAQVQIRFWWTKDAMNKMSVSRGESDISLVVTSPLELGLTRFSPTYLQICKRAGQLGLMLCPAEVGPALRLAYADQPEGELLKIGMSPIRVRDGREEIFCVSRFDGCRRLDAEDGSADGLHVPHAQFVFVRSH